jgi:hypothetical protein
MKKMCFCGECVSRLILGTGFHLIPSDVGYEFHADYDIDEEDMDCYLEIVLAVIKSGLEVGQDRWINGYDAYDNVDRAVLSRAGIDPRNEDIEANALAGLFAIARSSFIAGLTSNN